MDSKKPIRCKQVFLLKKYSSMCLHSFYGLLLPIDRMTGIGLDSINKPNINALKVLVMVIANIIGDLIAIFVFQSILLVAISSIFFTLIGIWLGMHFLSMDLSLQYNEIFKAGNKFYRTFFNQLKEMKTAHGVQIHN